MHNNREALRGFADMLNLNYMDYVPMLSSDESMEEFKAALNALLRDGETKERNKTNIDYMKELLEGITMPVYNEKTGEYDTVDLTLADKIKVDSEHVIDMATNKTVDISIKLEGRKEEEAIFVISEADVLGKAVHEIPLQTFEEILFETINSSKEQRLEQTERFSTITSSLVGRLIADNKKKHAHFSVLNKTNCLSKGIGIVTDTKTSTDIGTFEGIEYTYEKNGRNVLFYGIILSGRTYADLDEMDRYTYTFYSLEEEASYSFSTTNKSSFQEDGVDSRLVLVNFSLTTDTFENGKSAIYDVVEEADGLKLKLSHMDEDHPLYPETLEELRGNRLAILERSKQRYKEEKLVSQFADIELF